MNLTDYGRKDKKTTRQQTSPTVTVAKNWYVPSDPENRSQNGFPQIILLQ